MYGLQRNTGHELMALLEQEEPFLSVGIVSLLCVSTAAQRLNPNRGGFFLSGLAKTYAELGLPDEGHLRSDTMVTWARSVKKLFPEYHLIVDIDEGFGPPNVTCNVLDDLCSAASAVQYDDQDPASRRCGHLGGKVVIPVEEQLNNLERLLSHIGDEILIIARTDSPDFDDALRRARAYSELGAPIVLVDGLDHPDKISRIRDVVRPETRIMFNYIQGGKSAPFRASQLKAAGGDIMNFSTPFLLPYMEVGRKVIDQIISEDGFLPAGEFRLGDAVNMMKDNWNKLCLLARGRSRAPYARGKEGHQPVLSALTSESDAHQKGEVQGLLSVP